MRLCRAVVVGCALAAVPSCRLFMPERYAAWDLCTRAMPLLRAEPTQPYRVIKIVEGDNDQDLIERACDEGAEAVISMGVTSETTRRHGGSVTTLPDGTILYGGREKSSEDTRFRGYAIRWVK